MPLNFPGHRPIYSCVLWWFERDGKHTRIEVLHPPAGGYELHVFDADDTEHVEQFGDLAALRRRQQEIQDQLIAVGWKRSGEWLL